MAGLQRFISYIYKYENDEKKANAGFAKVEVRGSVCRMEVHIRGLQMDTAEGTVYLFARSGNYMRGIPVGGITISRGNGDIRYMFEIRDLQDFHVTMEQMEGMYMPISKGQYLASQWKEGQISQSYFRAMEKGEFLEERGSRTNRQETGTATESTPKVQTGAGIERTKEVQAGTGAERAQGVQAGTTAEQTKEVQTGTTAEQTKEVQTGTGAERNQEVQTGAGIERTKEVQAGTGAERAQEVQAGTTAERAQEVQTGIGADRNRAGKIMAGAGRIRAVQKKTAPNLSKKSVQVNNIALRRIKEKAKMQTGNSAAGVLEETNREVVPSVPRENDLQDTLEEPIHTTEIPLEKTMWDDSWAGIFKRLRLQKPIFYPFEGRDIECLRLEVKDIKEFPEKYWYFGNNSFLLHGFFNYGHFIFGEMHSSGGTEYLIGVPGIFLNQERIMASMFGFPEFQTAEVLEQKTGNFGYWYRII